eukprot:5377812-Amphidinium_carterae.1
MVVKRKAEDPEEAFPRSKPKAEGDVADDGHRKKAKRGDKESLDMEEGGSGRKGGKGNKGKGTGKGKGKHKEELQDH